MENHTSSYWQNIHHQRIALLGIMPPPFGGVSVHIARVMDCLSQQHNTLLLWPTEQSRFILPWYLFRLCWRLLRFRPQQLYYHSTYLKTSVVELIVLVMFRRFVPYKISIVDHDCRHLYRQTPRMQRWYRWVVQRVDAIICIGAATYASYQVHAIQAPGLRCEDAFIPPSTRHRALITQTYPSSLAVFIKEHTPILLVSAAHLMCIEGKDMYGIDTALYVLANIQDEYPDAGLIIGLPRIGNRSYFAWLQDYMKQLGISERVYILHNNKELWPLFSSVDLFIRPTLTDGDSISVREALHFNVPVVASDVCPRPTGVHCFKTHDNHHAVMVTKKILHEYVYGAYRERCAVYPQSVQ